jgi:hypothetical protein
MFRWDLNLSEHPEDQITNRFELRVIQLMVGHIETLVLPAGWTTHCEGQILIDNLALFLLVGHQSVNARVKLHFLKELIDSFGDLLSASDLLEKRSSFGSNHFEVLSSPQSELHFEMVLLTIGSSVSHDRQVDQFVRSISRLGHLLTPLSGVLLGSRVVQSFFVDTDPPLG